MGGSSWPHSRSATAGVHIQATLVQTTEILYTEDSGRVYEKLVIVTDVGIFCMHSSLQWWLQQKMVEVPA